MASIRRRQWQWDGKSKSAWVADYFDDAGKRHLKTFASRHAATAWLRGSAHDRLFQQAVDIIAKLRPNLSEPERSRLRQMLAAGDPVCNSPDRGQNGGDRL